MKIINIKPEVKEMLYILSIKGHRAYVVGGCVRDSLLGKEPKDWDICTSAKSEEIKEYFKEYKVINTGIKHGTVTVIGKDDNYEITTFRVDGKYSDSRHPDDVKFTLDLMEDLKRRDFTINAMVADIDGRVAGVPNAIEDLENKLIRCVGDPKERFKEDPLRMLRAIRFSIILGFKIDKDTYDTINKFKSLLIIGVSQERVTVEINKMLESSDPSRLLNFDIITNVVIPLAPTKHCIQNNPYHINVFGKPNTVYEHTTIALCHCGGYDLITKLAVLFHDVGKPFTMTTDDNGINHFYNHAELSATLVEHTMKKMKYNNSTIFKVCELIKYHDRSIKTKKSIRRLLRDMDNNTDQFNRLLQVKECDIKAQNYKYIGRLNDINDARNYLNDLNNTEDDNELCFTLKQLDINGDDLINMGYSIGKYIGIILKDLLNKVVDGELKNDRIELKRYVSERYPLMTKGRAINTNGEIKIIEENIDK